MAHVPAGCAYVAHLFRGEAVRPIRFFSRYVFHFRRKFKSLESEPFVAQGLRDLS